jgi:hypothetical protein
MTTRKYIRAFTRIFFPSAALGVLVAFFAALLFDWYLRMPSVISRAPRTNDREQVIEFALWSFVLATLISMPFVADFLATEARYSMRTLLVVLTVVCILLGALSLILRFFETTSA